MAVSPVSLQVAAGIRIQGLTETFLGVWLDQVDGMVYTVSYEIVRMLNNRDLPGVRQKGSAVRRNASWSRGIRKLVCRF
jgi:hypothetical protein